VAFRGAGWLIVTTEDTTKFVSASQWCKAATDGSGSTATTPAAVSEQAIAAKLS